MGGFILHRVIELDGTPGSHRQQSCPAELVARIHSGDPLAEEELVARYGRGVALILRRNASTPGAVEDLYQEVFLRAVEKIREGEVRDPERLSGFICGLCRNLAIDYFRRNPPANSLPESDSGATLRDRGPSPLERILRIEDAHDVREVLAELPSERYRQVLYRFYIIEEEKDRICTDLKMTRLQFNRILHRARERFRQLYEKRSKRPSSVKEG